MHDSRDLRELLLADIVLGRGLAPAHDVSLALERYWGKRGLTGTSIREELALIAALGEEQLASAAAEAERLLADAGGDATRVLASRGGIERSIHLTLSRIAGGDVHGLAEAGAVARTPLRRLDPERYTTFRSVGEGGMGIVYSALDTELNRIVAFKMIRPNDPGAPAMDRTPGPLDATLPAPETALSEAFGEMRARFLQEAWITAGLEHPGVVAIHEIGETPGAIPYYTMRFVPGLRTLEKAIADLASRPVEDRLALVEPFLRLCDTVAFAHSKTVVHRDIKPANVALGDFGEVVLLDWGIAKLGGHDDATASRWQARVREYRGATDFHTLASALGTPGYMSPEAATGEIDDVDAKSDVYSLGAVLFEILTGRLPFLFSTFFEYATQVVRDDPPRACSIDPAIPQALDDLCDSCLSRSREARPKDVASITRAIRTWQASSAMQREVAGHLRDAKAAIEAAGSLAGVDRLRQADRAAVALAQVASLDPHNAEAGALAQALSTTRERGQAERDSAARRRLLVRGGISALAFALVAAALIARAMDRKRQEADTARGEAVLARSEAETARGAAEAAKTETQAALDEVLRLADSKHVRDLLAEAEQLWPAAPERVPAMAAWAGHAQAVVDKRAGHEASLARLRAHALPYDDAARRRDHGEALDRIGAIGSRLQTLDVERSGLSAPEADARHGSIEKEISALTEERSTLQAEVERPVSYRFESGAADWQQQVLLDLLADLTRLSDPADATKGVLADVTRRHAFASSLVKASIEDHAGEWQATIEALEKSPRYGGLRIRAQVGLVPLGPDPDSGLFEFAHLGSGSIPQRDATSGRLVYQDDAAIVLVLIPGGTFAMGAQREDPGAPNYDPGAEPDEPPVRPVTLSPYFLAKHECTQAQWKALTGGLNLSTYKAGQILGDRQLTPRNPVEYVSWDDCGGQPGWLLRNRLMLPTEAQWEFGCRAGTLTPWITGTEAKGLGDVANICDRYCKTHGGPPAWPYSEEVEDGYAVHAPVGTFRANRFGLFDVHGNVAEWCRDGYVGAFTGTAKDPEGPGSNRRAYRGGAWSAPAGEVRSANRFWADHGFRRDALGVRPARPLTSE